MDVQLLLEKSRVGSTCRRFMSGLGPFAVVMVLALMLAGCGGGAGDTGSGGPVRTAKIPVTMAQKYTMDGKVDFSTFATVNSTDVTINDNMGNDGGVAVQTSALRWAMDNDDRNLYIALEWQDLTQNNGYDLSNGATDYDGIRVMFDVDGDGTFADGEDMRKLIAASVGSLYTDQHKVASGDDTDLIGDGYGKLSYNPATQKYQAELVLPLSQDAKGQDGALTSATRINFVLYDHVTPATGNVGYAFGSGSSSAAWPAISLKSGEVGFSHPALPGGLTGLVAFVGQQDAAAGEIYTMNPATGEVRRITTNTNLYMDKVALSHDRTRIAFEGVLCNFSADPPETIDQCRQRVDDYEIYRVNVDRTGLTKLTTNTTGDRHPAWSPDDTLLVYTSFRNGSNGALVVMDGDGGQIADLTYTSDDRDPGFLPDGRIVFATNRFTDTYKSRIGVMIDTDLDNDAMQLTVTDGVSDHAPNGDGSKTIFERFTMDLDPSTAVEALFAPWDLGEVPLAGGSETTLLADGWINRQPVIDPSGRYVAYLKNTGYSAAQLMGRDGTPCGRFIADVTTLRSLDWK